MIQLEYAPYSLRSSASVHSATKSARTCDLMAHRGLYVIYVEREELDSPFSNPARGIAVIYYVVEWYFGGHRNRTLLKVVS